MPVFSANALRLASEMAPIASVDAPVRTGFYTTSQPGALPVEVAAPVAQAAQRGGASGPVKHLGFPKTLHDRKAAEKRAAMSAPEAPAETPAENTPAAQVANTADKLQFDGVENTWDFWERPDMGYVQNYLMGLEKDPWNQADAKLAAQVAMGGLATVVGLPFLAAAVNELSG